MRRRGIALQGGDFSGNSVRICGRRNAPDSKFRCDWELAPLDQEPEACPCFNVNAEGSLVDPNSTCYDSHNFGSQILPNQSIEYMGQNDPPGQLHLRVAGPSA